MQLETTITVPPRPRKWLRAALAFGVAGALAGCAVGPDFQRPAPPKVNSFTSQPVGETASTSGHGGKAQHFVQVQQIQADWWRLFHSKQLDALIQQAFNRNPSLQAAQATLKEAQANLAVVKGGLYPQVNANLSATREKISGAQFGGAVGGSHIFDIYGASVGVSYNADVFGGVRRTIEAQQAQVDYQRYQLHAAYLTLIGNLTGYAINAASYRAQIKATENIIQAEENQLNLVDAQEKAGAVPYSDVLQARAQLAATRTRVAPLRQSLSVAEHQLATLSGKLPGNWQGTNFTLQDLTLPAELPLTVPSQLVHQRPDILAAESALHAASAQIGVAVADEYPQISLSGSYGSQATDIGDLFNAPSMIWNLGASLLAPIFHGGALRAKTEAARAAFEAAAAQYRQTVLAAFAQVADVLRALENDAASLKAQQVSRSAAEKSLQLARTQYKAGAVSFVTVLTAEQQYANAQLGYVQALAQRYLDTTSLFSALGGGWWSSAHSQTSDNGDKK
ncbi:MAG TPA: efflux transporter outer membrane subunit [Gammaproteobacteria bacterium]|nr:efflux transporter outer membrane subunit [Gammaproteobacteria bacterium]